MAGIGFKLQKMLEKETLTTDIISLVYSIFISAGPWIIMSITVFFIQFFSRRLELNFFKISMVYAFIFSTIIDGFFSMTITRRISDLIYTKDFSQIYKEYNGNVTLIFVISSAICFAFYIFNLKYYSIWQIVFSSYLFISLSIIWIQIIYMSAVQKFLPIIFSFVIGCSLALLGAMISKQTSELWIYASYDIGIGMIMYTMHFLISKYLRQRGISFAIFRSMKVYWKNFLAGIMYYLAVWIDDFIAWHTIGKTFYPGYRLAPSYDIPMFLSYLYIIPTLALFILIIETSFYERYRNFYFLLEHNGTLSEILREKESMDSNLKSGVFTIIAIQGAFTFVGLLLSRPISSLLRLPLDTLNVMRFGILGATFNAFFLLFMLLCFYFDFKDIVWRGSLLVFVSNFTISELIIRRYPGFSFAIAFLIGTLYMMDNFMKRYNDLIYFEYNRQKSGLLSGRVKKWKYEEK